MNKILKLIGRTKELFEKDIKNYEKELSNIVSSSTFLGGRPALRLGCSGASPSTPLSSLP
jgi:hypothetical protein